MDFEVVFNKVGKCFFVKYFEYFKAGYMAKDMLDIIEEPYTEKGIINRCNKARKIIIAGLEAEALDFVARAENIRRSYPDTAKRAIELLKLHYPEYKISPIKRLKSRKKKSSKNAVKAVRHKLF